MAINIKVCKIDERAKYPEYAHEKGDSGADLFAMENAIIEPFDRELVHTGISMEIPLGYEGCIRPRSGNALKKGYTILNTPGTIDSNYRGEIGVLLYNSTKDPILIEQGDRIAQIVFQKIPKINLIPADSLNESNRGISGFGSTGK